MNMDEDKLNRDYNTLKLSKAYGMSYSDLVNDNGISSSVISFMVIMSL